MPKKRGVIGAILRATRAEGMTVSERKRRDRLLLLAVLAGWFVALFELAAVAAATVFIQRESVPIDEVPSAAAIVSLVYLPPMLLAVLPFFVLYRRTMRRGARVFTIAAGSVLLPFLSASMFKLFSVLRDALSGSLYDRGYAWESVQAVLGVTAFGVLPALTVFLVISRSEFFRGNRTGNGGADVPVTVSPPSVDRTQTSGGVEFSAPWSVPT